MLNFHKVESYILFIVFTIFCINKEDRCDFIPRNFSDGSKSDYLIIDGQQRITTISLLFTAMVNLLKSGILKSQNETLQQEIEETFLVDKYRKEERKFRLKPIKDDMEALDKLLYNDSSDFVAGFNITANYQFFL